MSPKMMDGSYPLPKQRKGEPHTLILWVSTGIMVIILGLIVIVSIKIFEYLPHRNTYSAHRLPTAEELASQSLQKGRQAYFQLEDLSQALRYFEEAIALVPKKVEPWDAAGQMALLLKDYKKAKRYFSAAYQLDPNNTQVKLNYAIALLCNQEYEKAEEILSTFLTESNQNTMNFELQIVLASLYQAWGKKEQAQIHFAHAIQLGSMEKVEKLASLREWAYPIQELLKEWKIQNLTPKVVPSSTPSVHSNSPSNSPHGN